MGKLSVSINYYLWRSPLSHRPTSWLKRQKMECPEKERIFNLELFIQLKYFFTLNSGEILMQQVQWQNQRISAWTDLYKFTRCWFCKYVEG